MHTLRKPALYMFLLLFSPSFLQNHTVTTHEENLRKLNLITTPQLGRVLLGSAILGQFFVFCFLFWCSIREKNIFGCFGWSTFSTGIKLGSNGKKSMGIYHCHSCRLFKVSRRLQPCCRRSLGMTNPRSYPFNYVL